MTSPLSGRGAGGEGWPSAEAITRLPKAEVHVHLEGCFEPSDVEQLAQEAGESPRPTDVTGMDLAQFLALLDWTCSLVRTPGYAVAFVLTLGLGIGANTAIFSVVRGIWLRPLPHADGDRWRDSLLHAPSAADQLQVCQARGGHLGHRRDPLLYVAGHHSPHLAFEDHAGEGAAIALAHDRLAGREGREAAARRDRAQ